MRTNVASLERSRHSGFTILELLVCVFVTAILLSLLLPAVSVARESARRSRCLNNLKQLALGASLHESRTNTYFAKNFAILRIMSEIDDANVNRDLIESSDFRRQLRVSLLACPSDEIADPAIAAVSYRPIAGAGKTHVGAYHGASINYQPVGSRDISDGLSSTLLIGEKLIAAGADGQALMPGEILNEPLRGLWQTDESASDSHVIRCLRHRTVPTDTVVRARSVYGGGYSDHIDTWCLPNSPDCLPGTDFAPLAALPLNWVESASSRHRAGTNVAFCDGSARVTSDSIDLSVWRALGSRSSADLYAF